MFYDELAKMDEDEEMDYMWEEVDGQPRYRWYKNSLNAVHLIEHIDKLRDIENSSFSDLEHYYNSVNWVAHNDPEALKHIMCEITKPVTEIVKEKFLENLEALKYYEACAIVKESLESIPIPPERTHQRKKEKALEDIRLFVSNVESASEILFKLKTEYPHQLHNEEIRDNLGTLLNIDSLFSIDIPKAIDAMEWLRENAPADLKKQFTNKACIEIKDQLIRQLAEEEKFKLCSFINDTLKTHDLPDYFEIPAYNPNQKNELFPDSDFLSDDDDDD